MGKRNNNPPVIDPTANVILLTHEIRKHLENMRIGETRRQDDLRSAEAKRIDEKMALVAEYEKIIAKAEAKRIDSNRAFDVAAVNIAAAKAEATAGALAANVTASAETLRKMVESTAKAAAESLERWAATIATRLSVLEASRYETKGRQGLSTPLIVGISTIAGGVIGFLVQQLFKLGAIR